LEKGGKKGDHVGPLEGRRRVTFPDVWREQREQDQPKQVEFWRSWGEEKGENGGGHKNSLGSRKAALAQKGPYINMPAKRYSWKGKGGSSTVYW